jgi:hypothetical protein
MVVHSPLSSMNDFISREMRESYSIRAVCQNLDYPVGLARFFFWVLIRIQAKSQACQESLRKRE